MINQFIDSIQFLIYNQAIDSLKTIKRKKMKKIQLIILLISISTLSAGCITSTVPEDNYAVISNDGSMVFNVGVTPETTTTFKWFVNDVVVAAPCRRALMPAVHIPAAGRQQ